MGFDPQADPNAAGAADVAGGITPPAAAASDPVGPPPDPADPDTVTVTGTAAITSSSSGDPAPVDQAAAAAAPADEAHQAAADQVAASPIVWGDRGEVVQMAAKLLARVTGVGNAVADGTEPAMWNRDLAEACKAFQAAQGLSPALPGCVDQATWAALEAAAQGSSA